MSAEIWWLDTLDDGQWMVRKIFGPNLFYGTCNKHRCEKTVNLEEIQEFGNWRREKPIKVNLVKKKTCIVENKEADKVWQEWKWRECTKMVNWDFRKIEQVYSWKVNTFKKSLMAIHHFIFYGITFQYTDQVEFFSFKIFLRK